MIPPAPIERKWYCCPFCGTRLILYDNTAMCHGVFTKCPKCGREIEIFISDE